MRKLYLGALITMTLVSSMSMTCFAKPLPTEPTWDYISAKYPDGISVKEAYEEGITQSLPVYFDGYAAAHNNK